MDPNTENITIEIGTPASYSLWYIQAAVLTGLKQLQASKEFVRLAENHVAEECMQEAEDTLRAIGQCLEEAKAKVINQSSSQDDETVSDIPSAFGRSGEVSDECDDDVD